MGGSGPSNVTTPHPLVSFIHIVHRASFHCFLGEHTGTFGGCFPCVSWAEPEVHCTLGNGCLLRHTFVLYCQVLFSE